MISHTTFRLFKFATFFPLHSATSRAPHYRGAEEAPADLALVDPVEPPGRPDGLSEWVTRAGEQLGH